MDESIMDILKVLADRRMEISLLTVGEKNNEYKRIMEKVIGLEQEYESLNLKAEIKDLVDSLLAARDEANMEQASDAYLAGLQDCIIILRTLGLLQL